MNIIKKSKHYNTYGGEGMVGKYVYMKRVIKDYTLHYIFKIDEILDTNPVKYKTEKCFMFSVPKNKLIKCYVYDNTSKIEVQFDDNLYEMTPNEWLDTFRSFVKHEGIESGQLPEDFIK